MPGLDVSASNQYLSELISVGNDAMTNLYYLKFIGRVDNSDSEISQAMTVRAGDFQPPKPEQGNHTVDFLTVDSLMPSPEIKIDKQFDVTFRVDEEYKIYKYLLALQAATSEVAKGKAFTTTNLGQANDGFALEVYAPTDATAMKSLEIENGLPSDWEKIYSFDYLWVKKITPPKFSYENPAAVTITATFGFFTYSDYLRGEN